MKIAEILGGCQWPVNRGGFPFRKSAVEVAGVGGFGDFDALVIVRVQKVDGELLPPGARSL